MSSMYFKRIKIISFTGKINATKFLSGELKSFQMNSVNSGVMAGV